MTRDEKLIRLIRETAIEEGSAKHYILCWPILAGLLGRAVPRAKIIQSDVTIHEERLLDAIATRIE